MRKLGSLICLSAMLPLLGQEAAENEPELPQWKTEDWESVKKGELVPGSTIFGEIALERLFSGNQDPIVLDPKVREIPEEQPEPVTSPTAIGDGFLSSYFHNPPETFFVDPQGLLTKLEQMDREGFLKFHAADSGLDLYVYLFDAKQEFPVGESLQGVILDHFEEKGPAAVVFYFLGDPKRAELSFTGDLAGSVSRGSKRDLLKLSIEEAMEDEEPLDQLKSFSNQLSQRLYWLAKDLAEQGVLEERQNNLAGMSDDDEEAGVAAILWEDFKSDTNSFLAVVLSLGFAMSMGLFVAVRYVIDRKRVFVFPDAQGSPLLGAPHAPGVGSVISYSNRTEPPSLQRNNFPDYLQRM